ncbi:MAG TPA: Gfo/Idh/MocA family oxidoreductase [Phycisphaerae bacterium]|mgnify:CR=1 FL=1|nr:Gfo/Idh/MocA family oxidoreductase [Phycisphaerae bacterium]HPS52648.1 Gfo/Idh/MocA family oxidoreductase [Phycisphaerae bacterium]
MSKTGIAIVGASMRSIFMFAYLKENPQQGFITGVYDSIPQRGRYLLDSYGFKDGVIYDSLEQAVNDSRCQAVFIGTPDYAHVEPVRAALAAGKHVYCEKPLAITLEDCDAIIETAKTAKSVFYLGMNMRHSPVHEKMHQILTSGQLGRLLTIEANEYYVGGRTYFRRWNRLRKFGGGLWITKSCHDFDLLNWFAGGKPRCVFATSSLSYYKSKPDGGMYCRNCPIKTSCPDFFDVNNPDASKWPAQFNELAKITEKETGQMQDMCLYNSDKDTFDNGMAIVEYDNDVRATYTVNVVSARTTRQLRLTGTAAAAEGDMEAARITVWKRYSDEKTEYNLADEVYGSSHGGADSKILDDFFECCRTGKKPRSSWADGRLGIQVALAARNSCDTGQKISLK